MSVFPIDVCTLCQTSLSSAGFMGGHRSDSLQLLVLLVHLTSCESCDALYYSISFVNSML